MLGDTAVARELAVSAFEELDINDAGACAIVVDVGQGLGLVERALAVAEAACAETVNVYVVAGAARASLTSCTRGDLQRAVVLLDRAAAQFPNAVALFELDDAIRHRLGVDLDRLDRMSGLVVRSVEYRAARARRLLAACDFGAATRELRAASRNHDHALMLAEAYRLRGRLLEAKVMLRKSSVAQRSSSLFHLESGRIAELEGRIDDARASYRRAYAIDPELIERQLRAIELNPEWPKTTHDVEDLRCAIAQLDLAHDARRSFNARLDAIRPPS
jgi:tetratricopeptide (TPR) repeat protein